jgi:hypothetical protein
MQIVRRQLAPGDVDHELIWLTVSLGSLGFAIFWFGVGLPWPRCLFHDLTGLPCLTCGATRSTIAFLHFHFLDALRLNPLVFSTLCAIAVFDAYAIAVLLARAPRLRLAPMSANQKRVLRVGLIAVFLANWTYLLVTNPGV